MERGKDHLKKLIICVDRGRADEDRAGWNTGREGHVISREASRSVDLLGSGEREVKAEWRVNLSG